jgi:TrmH family RNA methyltransferase
VLYSAKLLRQERGERLLASLAGRACPVVEVKESVLDALADAKTSQGIVVLASRPRTGPEVLAAKLGDAPLLVVLHRLNNPSNAGAMVRVAEAAGASGLIATAGSTDMFSPKAIRGGMGSSFRLPMWTDVSWDEALAWCQSRGIQTVGTDLNAAQTHSEIDWRLPRAVILGPESQGLSENEVQAADARIRIPMQAPVESLNAAVALAVVLYEAARQRQRDR